MKDLSYYDIRGNKRSTQETANSYVIREPGNYCLPLVYGCGIKDGKINKDSYTVFTIPKEDCDYELIQAKLETHAIYYRPFPFLDYKNKPIQGPEIKKQIYGAKIISFDHSREFIKNLRIKNGYLEFTVLQIPGEGANYIIGALDKSSRVTWSWHLWLWKDELQDIEVGDQGINLLSENLGTFNLRSGIKLSWLYQWGRKDPLYPGKGNKKQRAFESIVTVGETIMNPDIMFGDRMLGFWLDDKKSMFIEGGNYCNYWNSKYWQENKVEKTVYDPCPPGYHVPEKYAFQFALRDDGGCWGYKNLPPHLRFPQILDYDKNKFLFERKQGDCLGIELMSGYIRDFSSRKHELERATYLTAAKDGHTNNIYALEFDYENSEGYIIDYYIYGDMAAYIRPQKEKRP